VRTFAPLLLATLCACATAPGRDADCRIEDCCYEQACGSYDETPGVYAIDLWACTDDDDTAWYLWDWSLTDEGADAVSNHGQEDCGQLGEQLTRWTDYWAEGEACAAVGVPDERVGARESVCPAR
jgi:hypothetical protein